MNREVTRPVLLRPPDLGRGSTSDFSGVCLVMPSRDTTVMKRRLGVVGENFLIAILHLREFGDLLASHELHVCLLPVRAVTGESSAAAQLAVEIRRAYCFHFYVEQFFDGLLHHDLVGIFRYLEAKRPLFFLLGDALFGDERP